MAFNFTNFPILKTERLLLRKASFKDIEAVFDLRSSKKINKFVGTKRVENLDEAKKFIQVCNDLYDQKKRVFWLIENNNQVIGSIVLHNILLDENYAEIGYKLKTEFQQKGMMTEAMKSILGFAFQELNVNTIEAFTHKNNMASIALLLKHGFTFQKNRKCDVYDFNRIYKLEK